MPSKNALKREKNLQTTEVGSSVESSPEDGAKLRLIGVRENNLKNLSLSFDHGKLIVITGVSGSGKSTLAFDTIYAEGGRRYIETFSPYTRQFLDRLHRPDVDTVSGIRPALALEQRNRVTNSRSTVGTVTEINDYLKVIWTHLATITCPDCHVPVKRNSARVLAESLAGLPEITSFPHLLVAFPLALQGEATLESIATTLQSEGFTRYLSPTANEVRRIEFLASEQLPPRTALPVLIERFECHTLITPDDDTRDRILSALNQAYTFGHGKLLLLFHDPEKRIVAEHLLSHDAVCPSCRKSFTNPRPSLFSFNSPLGACPICKGFGNVIAIDPVLCVPNPELSIKDGAIACWKSPSTRKLFRQLLAFCDAEGIDTSAPWSELPQRERDLIFQGTGRKKAKRRYRGIKGWFEKLQTKIYKMHVRVFLSRYRNQFPCPDCGGSRLTQEALSYRVNGLTLPDAWARPISDLIPFFESLAGSEAPNTTVRSKLASWEFSEVALKEVTSRLKYLANIGLSYLTLDRQSRTLSGGESQRVNLTTLLGSRLSNTTIVLDEPTIGLHSRDTARLIETMHALRDAGNTVFVVEHDPAVMVAADEILDLGPDAGSAGGEIVYQGNVTDILDVKNSHTGKFLKTGQLPERQRPKEVSATTRGTLTVQGARAHNLKNIDVSIPLGKFVVLTGVSGSGKTTLITNCLTVVSDQLRRGVALKSILEQPNIPIRGLDGLDTLDEIVLIDQSPIGKTPRSNPATYTKIWDTLRECLASTPDAERLGLGKSAFSFNVPGGRCPNCKGSGHHRIEMQFLADVFVECETCGGSRFQEKVLTVRYGGKNVIDLLNLALSELSEFLASRGEDSRAALVQSQISALLKLGLGYLRLGQPLSEISGGEAQRIKLASYLNDSAKRRCLFILDEPTTGLHPVNIADLLATFHELIALGHSILCVEHNLEVIRRADWMIELGPEGGAGGGQIVVEGEPSQLIHSKKTSASPTLVALQNDPATVPLTAVNPRVVTRRSIPDLSQSRHPSSIEILGAREHNLQNVSVSIPHNKLTVITGVSGSGKSTLAFDILFAEGQRRYIDSLSPYARQFLTQLKRAEVDAIHAIPPTVAISQKTAPPLGVSTIATTTELYQYLRLLYSKVGIQHCPVHDVPIIGFSPDALVDQIIEEYGDSRVFLFAPVVSGRKGFYNDLFQRAYLAEITEARVDGKIISIHPELRLERHKLHWISLLVASVTKPEKNRDLIRSAVEQCLLLADGTIELVPETKGGKPQVLSVARMCPKCKTGFRELDPQDFSFRSNRGVCNRCGGRGKLEPLGKKNGALRTCPECEGARIGSIGRHVYLDGKAIHELSLMTAPQLHRFLSNMRFDERLKPVVTPIVTELLHRLQVVSRVGLDYLSLDRDAHTISGGEAQRLRLAKTLGSPLTGICYVLDEPTIGLHPQDHGQLMDTLCELRDRGNTVVVVEHDEDTIRKADHLIDVGPRGGKGGGRIVAEGSVAELLKSSDSVTGGALRERKAAPLPVSSGRPVPKSQLLTVTGARSNNLKKVTASFPVGKLSVVVGVSGAGKSSLVHGTLVPAVRESFTTSKRSKSNERNWDQLLNHQTLQRLVEIDQTPIGKTSTSSPASYLGIFNDIRKVYAMLPEARARGWTASHFSFNTGKGRCETCSGRGFLTIPMNFLPDATTPCEECNGLRYNEETLSLLYQGVSIGDLLQKTMGDAREILANHSAVRRTLDYVYELGLDYLTLGQPTYTLSGGEAQRLKIATELGSRDAVNTLYILDEPTVGLHMVDVDRLVNVLHKLVAKGNTVIVIEHNLDVLNAADHVVEVGPGPGAAGGEILFSGTPSELAHGKLETPTSRCLKEALQPAATFRSAAG